MIEEVDETRPHSGDAPQDPYLLQETREKLNEVIRIVNYLIKAREWESSHDL